MFWHIFSCGSFARLDECSSRGSECSYVIIYPSVQEDHNSPISGMYVLKLWKVKVMYCI